MSSSMMCNVLMTLGIMPAIADSGSKNIDKFWNTLENCPNAFTINNINMFPWKRYPFLFETIDKYLKEN